MALPKWFPILTILIAWSLDTNDVAVQEMSRIGFAVSQLLTLALCIGLYVVIRRRAPTGSVVVAHAPTAGAKEYNETMTVQEHDMRKLQQFFGTRFLLPCGITMLIVWKWNAVVPMVIQSIIIPLTLVQTELFKVYIQGVEAKHELARPWKDADQTPEWLKSFTAPAEKHDGRNKRK
jgi:hypothetical protein